MYLAVDIGGTKTLLAVFDNSGELTKQVKFATSKNYKDFLHVFADKFEDLGDIDFKAGAVAIAGVLDRQHQRILSMGNLNWTKFDLGRDLETIVKAPIAVENDAKVGGLYEAINIINEFKKVLYVTIGTGIGTSLIVNGIIDNNLGDTGGHDMLIQQGDKLVSWEELASGHAIVKRYGARASDIDDSKTWQEISKNIAIGLIDMIVITAPQVVIIGGGVATQFSKFSSYLKQDLKKLETPMLPVPPIRQAQRAEEAVIYGCFELIKQNYGHHFK